MNIQTFVHKQIRSDSDVGLSEISDPVHDLVHLSSGSVSGPSQLRIRIWSISAPDPEPWQYAEDVPDSQRAEIYKVKGWH